MSELKTSPDDKTGKKRNLPSWMSSRGEENDDDENTKQARIHSKGKKDQNALHTQPGHQEESSSVAYSGATTFSKLMEGVVFVLSGVVNPERGVLRSQMLEMGADYQPDWNSKCTLLICAFPNTPEFCQVEADCGTIVSKDWVSLCYDQRKLVDIETYLLHAGKPWKRKGVLDEARQDTGQSTSRKSTIPEEKKLHSNPTTSASSKITDCFPPSEVKKWAIEDLTKTISWLENQEEKPELSEIKKIASEGILTCLQDAIESLKQGQDIQHIAEQWACIPRVVEEIAKFDDNYGDQDSLHKEDLQRQAISCKQIYELEYSKMDDDISIKKKTSKTKRSESGNMKKTLVRDDTAYDSDETVEMTEEEIDEAYNTVARVFANAKEVSP
ncbi:DNA-repair XRCC1 [Olea europaea subsp. europaea]|uniref:DNA-repair XRCC1 n=1 Tax=Olea europaea subsp. europaea TaxID=158383 RepID=A0A8S0S831_OLEEU|nr:DNA-repair XRCC1 [Olea europaea subsp. europaea]